MAGDSTLYMGTWKQGCRFFTGDLNEVAIWRRAFEKLPHEGPAFCAPTGLVLRPPRAREDKARLEVARVTTLFPDVAASARATVRFHHQHVRALRKAFSAPCWPKPGTASDVAYDPARGRLAVTLSCTANLFANKRSAPAGRS